MTLLFGCRTGTTKTDGTSPLLLQAFGGPSGQVAAHVPLVEAGVGLQQTCMTPVSGSTSHGVFEVTLQ
jgi:hypothetical protein